MPDSGACSATRLGSICTPILSIILWSPKVGGHGEGVWDGVTAALLRPQRRPAPLHGTVDLSRSATER